MKITRWKRFELQRHDGQETKALLRRYYLNSEEIRIYGHRSRDRGPLFNKPISFDQDLYNMASVPAI